MKILLAFMHKTPGRGEIRARVYANGEKARTLTVGTYYRDGAWWTARLWAVPGRGRRLAEGGVITASSVTQLSSAAAARGKWWA